ncbi:MAG: HDIG domain-containing protein [Spirosomataceae bacterium]
MNIPEKVNQLFALYEHHGGNEYIGEPVTILEHSVQSAQLAESEGYDEEVILAALFHDIGHLMPMQSHEDMNGMGHLSHEKVGAAYIQEMGFSEKVTFLINAHVAAKRYLCFAQPAYYDKLSEASRQTLVFQGGVMTAQEAADFERHPLFQLSLRMRYWDEAAKETEQPIPDMNHYKQMAERSLSL